MPVKPYPPRHMPEDRGDAIRITIPSRKNWFNIFFTGFWLVGWTLGEITVIAMIIAGLVALIAGKGPQTSGGIGGMFFMGLFILAWLGVWTVGGVFAWRSFLWNLAGKEIVDITYPSITLRSNISVFSRPREYLAEHIRELRVCPGSQHGDGWSNFFLWSTPKGSLAFDYGARTIYFGSGVEEAEAKQILSTIQQRFPRYQRM